MPRTNSIYSDVNSNYRGESLSEVLVDIDAVNGSIENILNTTPGERFFLPEFGSNLLDLIHEPINEETSELILDRVSLAIEQWEHRVRLRYAESRVIPYPDRNLYDLTLIYDVIGLDQEGVFRGNIRLEAT